MIFFISKAWILTSELSYFPTMSVTYQVNYLIKLSDNVCDVSSQPYHPISWQCVWHIRQTVSPYHPIFRQCPWHIRSTTSLNFLTMCVTYQVNLIIQFSDKVWNKSGELYYCIISFSDNVHDISGQLRCSIFWQCAWQIRRTLSLYHPIFRQCPWHIRSTTLKNVLWRVKSTLSSNFLTMCVTNQAIFITVSSHFPTMSVTYQVNYLDNFSDNVCDISSQLYHPIFWHCALQIRRTVSLYHPIFRQCPWHIRSTTLLKFLTMCVTYQVNLIIQFSDNVCCKSDKLYHCIISFSDNVCDISGELPCQISCQCVWHIRTTV